MNIVCTGYGIIAPNTVNIDQYLFNLKNGVCCIETVENAGPQNESNIVGIIKAGIEKFENDKLLKRLPRVTKLGMAATEEAIQSANLDLKNRKIGLFWGSSLGSFIEQSFQDSIILSNEDNYRKIPMTFTHLANHHSSTASIAHYIGTNGITKTITTGCTSSLEAVQDAILYLKSGIIDIAIVGGSDSPISKATTYAFAKTKGLPLNQDIFTGAVPFQEDSNGFAVSEAAGAIILERKDEAIKREAHIKGEIVDVISNNDSVYNFSAEETGQQMINALKEITHGRKPDYVNSQALGFQLNDRIEKRCSEEIFNHQVPYTSIKSMIGHPFGASGMVQVIASLLSIQNNFIPPTIRTSKKGFENMNIVTTTKYQEINEVVITNHGLGGNNTCAYIKKSS
jgi:3-oxoacyl-(acyl-carrier-protein) synthase